MNLRLRKYNISKESKDKVEELYFSAFPKDEQLPYWMMKLLSRKKSADFYSIYDKKDFVGLAYVATYKDTAYLCFFAIDERQRLRFSFPFSIKRKVQKLQNFVGY